jgi:hypothetical protein
LECPETQISISQGGLARGEDYARQAEIARKRADELDAKRERLEELLEAEPLSFWEIRAC